MKKMISRIAAFFITAPLVLISASSCQKDGAEGSVLGRGHRIGVNAGADVFKSVSGGSEQFDSFYLGQVDGDSLFVEAYVQENDLLPFEGEQTKGSIETTSSVHTAAAFMMGGWLGSTNRYTTDMTGGVWDKNDATDYNFIKMQKVVYDSSKSKWNWASGSYQWRNAVPSTFWSYYPETVSGRTLTFPSSTATDAQQKVVTMGYTLPTGTTDAATRQPDLLLAYNCQTWTDSNNKETVDVKFKHALAAVRFEVSGALKEGATVTNIALKNIAASGSCTASVTEGALGFAWVPGGSTVTVGQDYVSTDFTEKSLDGETDDALMALTSSKFFFVIPQTVKNAVSLRITYTRPDGSEFNVESLLVHDQAWEAGKIYTYKIGVKPENVDLAVQEDMTTVDVKKTVNFKNTGKCKAWIRAAVVANWFDDSGNIVAPWNESTEGTFSGFPGSDWEKGDDGFYYYKNVVAVGANTSDLIGSFTRPTKAGMHLEMKVMAQAIKYDSNKTYKTVWSY